MSDTSDLIEEFSETVTFTRFEGGSYSGLDYVAGTTSTFDVEISLQPLSGKELLQLPEGQRTKQTIKGYTETQLLTARESESKKADEFDYEGVTFEVHVVLPYKGDVLNHYKIIAVEKSL